MQMYIQYGAKLGGIKKAPTAVPISITSLKNQHPFWKAALQSLDDWTSIISKERKKKKRAMAKKRRYMALML